MADATNFIAVKIFPLSIADDSEIKGANWESKTNEDDYLKASGVPRRSYANFSNLANNPTPLTRRSCSFHPAAYLKSFGRTLPFRKTEIQPSSPSAMPHG
jgi:hypothetical protein